MVQSNCVFRAVIIYCRLQLTAQEQIKMLLRKILYGYKPHLSTLYNVNFIYNWMFWKLLINNLIVRLSFIKKISLSFWCQLRDSH